MKKLFSLIIALVATSSLCASGFRFRLGDLFYWVKENENEVEVVDAYNTDYIHIQEKITYKDVTYIVTSIGGGAFGGCSSLTSITIPNSVTSIGKGAFQGCSSLTSITIPKGVTCIEDLTFQFCTSLKSITIPHSVTSIGGGAFDGCSNLTSVTIPENVTSIGEGAFQDCSSLSSITIPKSVTSIGTCAFNFCSSLKFITIPENVTSIGTAAFQYCSSLSSITIPKSVTSIGNNAFYNCSSLTSISIPKNVKSIEGYTFYNCSSLTSVTLPDSVTTIGSHAFYGCSSLTSIRIPKSVTSIGEYAFSHCSAITSIIIPDSVKNITAGIFSDCKSLTSVTLPDSVTTIGSYAFDCCSSLASIGIPNKVTSIGEHAFSDCSAITSIIIPEGVKDITDGVFSRCSSLIWVAIPRSVTSIGELAFQLCTSLTSIAIPNGVTSIGNYAFRNCYALTFLSIPNTVTSIGESAFYGCTDLEKIYCYPITPPTIYENTFNIYNATLYVPSDSKEAYKEHPVFGKFRKIKGIGSSEYVTTHIYDTICQGEVYEFGGGLYDATGIYKSTIDLIPTYLYLTVLPRIIDTITIDACDSYEWHGKVYTMSGDYTYHRDIEDSAEYCYTEILHLTINKSTYEDVVVEAVDSCEWHGVVYTESGTYVYYKDECSTEILHLTVIQSDDNQGGIVVEPFTNSVTITWKKEDNADNYTIIVKQGDNVVSTLIFDADGNLISVNYLPAREANEQGIQYTAQVGDSFQYTITGLTPSTDYTYTVTATDHTGNTIKSYSGEFTTESSTAVEDINASTNNVRKLFRGGQLLIIREGKTYNAQGAIIN